MARARRLLGTLPLAVALVMLFVTLVERARRGAADGLQFVLIVSLLALYLL
jgi:hypothetical protein